jgi:CheY-like chemotaxis protein
MAQPSDVPLRVLIVDDRRDNVLLLKTLLLRAGHDVMTADDGANGLDAVRTFLPNVVISDIGLPGPMDGYALAEAIRNDPAAAYPYVIAVTGYDDEEHRQRAQEAGFHHYLVKPAPIDELLSVLADIDRARGGSSAPGGG